jgi:antitoxin component of RelBE/YafQ-DinJ toxin-antitoxin module
VGDDEFYASLAPVSLNRDEAVRVRLEVARATRIPVDLISASDTISELETVGNCSHASILDYFADLLPVEKPKNESVLVTVRDLVIEFGPQFR